MAAGGEKGSPFEILGAWLGIWTPRQDVVIPPPPSRRTLALLAAGLLAVAAVVAFAVAPALREIRDRNAAAEARADARRDAAERARLQAEQRPRRGRIEAAGRTAVLTGVARRIDADARRRFDPDARRTRCEPAPGSAPDGARTAFDCHALIREIVGAGAQAGARGALTIPYRAVVDFRSGAYAFCKLNPPPGEKALPDPRRTVALEPACRIPGR